MTVHSFKKDIVDVISAACRDLGGEVESAQIALNAVPENQFGDIAMTCFALRGKLKNLDPKAQNNPVAISSALAEKLADCPYFSGVKACGPYLNMAYNTSLLSQIVVGEILEKGDHFGDAVSPTE